MEWDQRTTSRTRFISEKRSPATNKRRPKTMSYTFHSHHARNSFVIFFREYQKKQNDAFCYVVGLPPSPDARSLVSRGVQSSLRRDAESRTQHDRSRGSTYGTDRPSSQRGRFSVGPSHVDHIDERFRNLKSAKVHFSKFDPLETADGTLSQTTGADGTHAKVEAGCADVIHIS